MDYALYFIHVREHIFSESDIKSNEILKIRKTISGSRKGIKQIVIQNPCAKKNNTFDSPIYLNDISYLHTYVQKDI